MRRTDRYGRRAWAEALEPRRMLTQLADLDRDGDLDAFDRGEWFQNVNGKGDFARTSLSNMAAMSIGGDIDGDGDQDLVTAPLAWFENDGQGPRQQHSIPSPGINSIQQMKLTDVGNDGRLDLVVYNSTQLSLLRNTDGRGTFQVEFTTPIADLADAGDVDNDGDLDLLILKEGRVSLDRNTNGSFAREFLFENRQIGETSHSTLHVFWEDMNGDHLLDLVRDGSRVTFPFYGTTLSWTPMAQAAQAIENSTPILNGCGHSFSGSFGNFHLTDVDEDGDVDAWCFGTLNLEDGISTALNNGAGQFAQAGEVRVIHSFNLDFTDAGDVNRDGIIDYISSTIRDGAPVWVDGATKQIHEPTRAAIFNTTPVSFGVGNRYSGIELAEVNGDGKLDALLANGANLEWWVASRSNASAWTLRQTLTLPATIHHLSVHNLNARAGDDLAIATSQGISIVTLDGNGSLTYTNVGAVSGSFSDVAIGDLDEDGDRDLLVASSSVGAGAKAFQVLLNGGNTQFTLGSSFGDASVSRVQLGDFDADGDLDAAVLAANPFKRIWWNDGSGKYPRFLDLSAQGPSSDLAVADFDRSGATDLYVVHSTLKTDEVYMWPQPADQEFPAIQSREQDALAVALGDIDNDGDYDAVLATEANQDSSVKLNLGQGRFVSTFDRATRSRSLGVALGDADGDGDLDVFYANEGSVELYLNRVNPLLPRTDLLPPRPEPRIDDHGNSVEEATALPQPTLDLPLRAQGKIEFKGDVDAFLFPVTPNARYRIRATGKELRVTWTDGWELVTSRDQEFFVAVRAGGVSVDQALVKISGAVGPYELWVEPAPLDYGGTKTEATPITVPAVKSGRLSGTYEEDWMRFQHELGATYELQLQTTNKNPATLSARQTAGDPHVVQTDANGFARLLFEPVFQFGSNSFLTVQCNPTCTEGFNYSLVISKVGQDDDPQGTVAGDANLDGIFNSSDLVQVFSYGQFEDAIEDNSAWWSGDWNNDDDFTTADLVYAMQMGTYTDRTTRAARASAAENVFSELPSAAVESASGDASTEAETDMLRAALDALLAVDQKRKR